MIQGKGQASLVNVIALLNHGRKSRINWAIHGQKSKMWLI
jgi:hypothetical protein